MIHSMEEIFGSMVFNDYVMQSRLPKTVYKALKRTMELGKGLDPSIADTVAAAMKDWAVEKGVTHYTHWFQPMTGVTAEKHDSFISPVSPSKVIMEFSGKELIKGESDASSFPSGGLRATFEARGYTAWDPSSYAFIKDGVLCIPTVFYSYNGEALDKKGPLLASMEALNRQALRILKLFGTVANRVQATVGPEQEYFLVDKALYDQREDLRLCGRTLFGAMPPKGQELDDHYYGAIKPRVEAYMTELNEELWKLGVLAKTEHNEVAPAQHELAPIFTNASIASDQNQLTMEMMQKVALRHGLVCLLHEKPFEGVNGSGKHNNWSMSTDTGLNLLEPGGSPNENAQFMLFMTAVVAAVDEYQALLRMSVASAGNDHRLGANEAPPAVISIFLGNELEEIVTSIITGAVYDPKTKEEMKLGVHILPRFPRDTTDRNRTSPVAFTGNKFEFRMPGSSLSISGPNIIINTAVAEILRRYADRLEQAEHFNEELNVLIKEELTAHQRVIFNGNGYGEEWKQEAARRGLMNLPTLPDAVQYFVSKESIALFSQHKIFTVQELQARADIFLVNYCKVLRIEGLTMIDMARKQIIPAGFDNIKELTDVAVGKQSLSLSVEYERKTIDHLSHLVEEISRQTDVLQKRIAESQAYEDHQKKAEFYRDQVIPAMNALRQAADQLESEVGAKYWPYPVYSDLLFRI
ncbi:MAG TPA: glutamine synthetase III [Candidatus Faecimorpha stercoravium]|nr:glutamine synthetase III [Candidatus Faecimorpha stercoravium]